jgi:hypothetical protein
MIDTSFEGVVTIMVKRGQPPAGYLTATRAKQRLGHISDGKLKVLADTGKIERYIPPGMKQGFYKIEDIKRLADELNGISDGTQFQIATKDDIPEVVNLLIEIFGGGNTTEMRLKWIEKNPEIAFILKSQKKIVGIAFVLPLSLKKIESILSDPTPGSTRILSPEDIQPYNPTEPAYLYVVSMGTKAGVTPSLRRIRGQLLIRGLINFFTDLGKRGIHIKMIAARTQSHDGINILRHIGFTEIESNTELRNFIIEVDRSGLPFVKQYKKALAEYRQHSREDK